MRTSLLLIVTGSIAAGLGGCNRMHLYKTQGRATVAAFQVQAEGTNAPRPRGIDGDEASLIIHTENTSFAPSDDNTSNPNGSGGAPKAPTGIPLQVR